MRLVYSYGDPVLWVARGSKAAHTLARFMGVAYFAADTGGDLELEEA